MKVAVITRHAIANYGSLLQAIATQRVIENLGHTCEIIDYVRDDESYSQLERTLLKRKKDWNNNPIKRFIYLVLRQPESISAGKRFEKARAKYLHLTRRYETLAQLKNDVPAAEVYVTGSDQVWGPVANGSYDSSYCLSFVTDDKKKIAYAASFGHTEITEALSAYYKKWLSRYEHISVREESAVGILNSIGLRSDQVLDPTLLLDATYWSGFITESPKGKYVLVYQLHSDKKLGKYARKVAKEKGLPLIRVSASLHQMSREGKFVWCPDLSTFLAYIKNAECIITDSFHGTAFAINFNTPFVEVLPNNNTGTRNMSILSLTKLTEQILQDENNIALANNTVDFSYANDVIAKMRKESIARLKKMIGH